ncbi:MAG TPA: tRNA dihydrouridine synthase DusB [Candidatus Nanoarchaeia archaeon]|nr:tRNA dihydrouridine synthase DusB [Candidatus Nanoarchaeia archaeon]
MKFPKLRSLAVLSPMSGVTDVAFRTLAARYGAGLTYTEFTNGTAVVRGYPFVLKRVATDPSEKPVAVQLFGNSVDDVVKAAKMVENQFDIIDVNCGCPAWKVIKTGSGSELLKDPEKIASFVNKLVSAVNKPVTVKIRIGIDDAQINAIEVAKLVENAGAAAIAVHGRTQAQGYSGIANWDIIRQVKEHVNIPVIGNGDVFTPEQFKKRLDESGVDAIMIARGAIGNPFIFKQINDYLATGTYKKENRIEQFMEYVQLAQKYRLNFDSLKTQAMSFTKGIIGGAKLRMKLATSTSAEEICTIINMQLLT